MTRTSTSMSRTVIGRTVVGVLFGASLTAATGAVAAGAPASAHGVFDETGLGAAAPLGYDIHGSAKMTVRDGRTDVAINVSGLDTAKTYSAHLHDGTCASGGGGHYQDVVSSDPLLKQPPNELWLTAGAVALTPNDGGVAHGSGSAPWEARTTSTTTTNARSVVVHEPGGARIACADLG